MKNKMESKKPESMSSMSKKKMDKKMKGKDMKSEAKKMGCDMKGCQMAHKLDVKKVADAMKVAIKDSKKILPKTLFNPVIKLGIRERDMRNEAMAMGSHQAKEYFEEGLPSDKQE